MIEVNPRTALLAFAALGLVAGGFAPTASADHEIPAKQPDNCPQIYLGSWTVGPVTVDASDGCAKIVLEHEAPATTSAEPPVWCKVDPSSDDPLLDCEGEIFEPCPQSHCPPKPGE